MKNITTNFLFLLTAIAMIIGCNNTTPKQSVSNYVTSDIRLKKDTVRFNSGASPLDSIIPYYTFKWNGLSTWDTTSINLSPIAQQMLSKYGTNAAISYNSSFSVPKQVTQSEYYNNYPSSEYSKYVDWDGTDSIYLISGLIGQLSINKDYLYATYGNALMQANRHITVTRKAKVNSQVVSSGYSQISEVNNIPLEAGKRYKFECWIRYKTTATSVGAGLGIFAPSGVHFVDMKMKEFNGSYVYFNDQLGSAIPTIATISTPNTTANIAYFTGVLQPSVNGTFSPYARVQVSGGTVTILPHTMVMVEELKTK